MTQSQFQESLCDDDNSQLELPGTRSGGGSACSNDESQTHQPGTRSGGGSACSNDESQTRQPGTRSGGGSDGMDEAQSSGSQMQSKV